MNEIRKLRSWQEAIQEGLIEKALDPSDRVISIRPFVIKEVNLYTLKRFSTFCNHNSTGDWGIGLGLLLDLADNYMKKNSPEYIEALEARISAVEAVVGAYEQKMTEQAKQEIEPKRIKTFGGA